MVDPTKTSTISSARTLPPVSAKPVAANSQVPPSPQMAKANRPANFSSVPFWMGVALSILWVTVVALVLMQAGAARTFAGLPLVNWAIGVSAIASPVALIWMVTAYLQRAADVQSVAEPLRRQLMMITGESGAAEVRIRRFNQAVREQLDLLKSTQSINHDGLMAIMDRVRQHKNELEQFEQQSVHQVKEIQEVIRRSMQHIEHLMEDKFTMLRILDGKLVQSGDGVAKQTETVREQLTSLLQDIEENTQLVGSALERAMRDSKKLADTARTQETSLVSAAETVSSTLQEMSGKIDFNIAHFLERASTAREQAERIAGALDTQVRSLDEFSSTLPARVSEAETVLRGVADRLYTSEQLACEQATKLSAQLSAQVDGLQNVLERISGKFVDIDGSLQQRSSDLDGLVVRISGATDDMAQQLDSCIVNLDERAQGSLRQFVAVNEEARRGVDDIAAHLAETAARYESATKQLSGVSEANSNQLRALTNEIGEQIAQFEALQNASMNAGQEVQNRASVALQNMQHVLERLLSTRDATQTLSEALTTKLHAAVESNEYVITRINEAAQMTVHALGVATESLTAQESQINDQAHISEATLRTTMTQLQNQARSAEQAMREQNTTLMGILKETQDKLDAADVHLRGFAEQAAVPVQQVMSQIEQSTARGTVVLGQYGDNMNEQLGRLQQFNARVSGMSEEVGRLTSETLSAIESLNTRFLAARAAQDETTRATLDQFGAVADRLQKEVGSLDGQTAEAVSLLQKAANQVGEQSQQMQREAQDAGAKIQLVTTTLQNEASQIRSVLQKQTDGLNADLSLAEQQFQMLGDSLKQRTDSAYALLDRVAAHYNDITRAAANEFEERANKLDRTAVQASDRVQSLSNSLSGQLDMINSGSTQLEAHAAMIAGTTSKTLQHLTILNDKLIVTQEATANGAQQAVARLDEANSAFMRQNNTLNDASQNAVIMIQKAGTSFSEQASKMLDTSHQVEQNIRSLNAATTAFADQTAQVRTIMEQHNQRLISSLNESVSQLDVTNSKMQQITAAATYGADQAATRFADMTQNASERITGTSHELMALADRAETTLGTLGASVTQQVASLNLVGEQLSEQHRALTAANENQRAQLVDLFDKLGGAHSQASEVAERTITFLNDALQQIQRQLGALGDQSQTAVANVRNASGSFADQSGMLLQHAQQAEQQARTVLSVTAALQDQARELREALHGEGERTADMLGNLLGKLSSGNTELRELSATAEITLTSLQHNVGSQTSALNTTMQQISDRQRSLTTALDAQRDVLNGLLSRLTIAHDETSAVADRTAVRITEGTQQIARQVEIIDTQAQTTLANVRSATAGFASEAAALNQHAQQAEQQTRAMYASTSSLQDQARQLREAMQSESERTSEILDSLLNKIKNGGSDLRSTSTVTESALSELHGAINEQTSTLINSMQQAAERQRTLSSSLDMQRETLNGLLGRLVLAQDETAAAAERNVARLSDSTQQIAKQMETIEAQAQNTLASVRAANAGFVDEAGSLNAHAQQVEQQARGMLSVTAGMQEQTRQLREAMQGESARVIEQMNGMISNLDITGQQFKQQTGSAIHAMDQSVLQFTSLAKSAGETLQEQAENLTEVAAQTEARTNSASDKIRSHIKIVNEAGELSEQQARQLADTAEYATTRLVTLLTTMNEGEKDGRGLLDQASARIAEVRATLQRELEEVAAISQQAVQQVTAAGQYLGSQSDALRSNLASSESALNEAANLVREESTQLPTVLDRSTLKIAEAGQAFADHTGTINKEMLQTADRFISVTGSVRDTMMDEMRRLNNMVDTADHTLRQFNQALVEQINAFKHNGHSLSGEQSALVEKSVQAVAQLAAAAERLAKIRENTLQTTEKLAREFELIETSAGSTTQRLTLASEGLNKQVILLAQNTEKAEGQLSSASQSFRDQLERIRTGVQMQIDDINRGLMQITAQLERTSTSLRTATAGTVADVEKIATRFDSTSKETVHQLTDRTARMRVATEEVARLLSGFGDQIDVLLDRLAVAGDGIKRHENDVIGQLQIALTHLSSVSERLESNRVLTADVSDEAVARLSEVASVVEKQMQNMKAGSQTVTDIVQGVGQMYTDQTQGLNRSVLDAQSQVLVMNKSIEEMQQRTDRMRVALKMQSEDLMSSLEQILRQLADAGDGLDEIADKTVKKIS